jgi:hypothetical protein
MTLRSRERAWFVPLSVAVGFSSGTASANDGLDSARTIYDMGSEAHATGDFETAAALFARADELSESDVALEAALRAAVRADAPVLGLMLVGRADDRDSEGSLEQAAESARRRFEGRVGSLRITCDDCDVSIDDEPSRPGEHRVEVGHHLVVMTKGDDSERILAHVGAHETTRVRPRWDERSSSSEAAPAGLPDTAPSPSGLSKGWFWAASGLTAAVSVATAVSAIDMVQQHKAFQGEPTPERADQGRAAEQRTHILLGVTGAMVLATTAVGLFGIQWSDGNRAVTGGVAPLPGGAAASATLAF